MMPATLSIITQAFPAEQRGTAIGTWAGVSALALAIGPVLGGFLTEYVSWRAIFWINPPIAIGAVAVTLFAARESRDETVDKTVDFPGIAAITIGLTALVLALVEGNELGLGLDPRDLAAGHRCGRPDRVRADRTARQGADGRLRLLPLAHVPGRQPRRLPGHASRCSRSSSSSRSTCRTSSATRRCEAGIRFLPSTLVIIVMGPLAGRLTDRVGPRPLMTARPADRLGRDLRPVRDHRPHRLRPLLPGFVLMGIGIGLVMSPMSTAAMNAVDRTKAGAASGVLSMSRMVGGTFGVAVMGALIATIGRSKIDAAPPPCSVAHAGDAGQLARRRRHPARLGAGRRCRPRGVRVGARHRACGSAPRSRSAEQSPPGC